MKLCVKCNSKLTRYSNYWKCKPCQKQIATNYRNTPRGKAMQMWYGLQHRAGNKSGRLPAYARVEVRVTKEAFVQWAIKELDKWVQKGYTVNIATLDRKNGKGHYELDNLQFLTLEENAKKKESNKNLTAPEGFAWCGKCKDYLTVDNFWKDSRTKHGLRCWCKEHCKIYEKLSYGRKSHPSV